MLSHPRRRRAIIAVAVAALLNFSVGCSSTSMRSPSDNNSSGPPGSATSVEAPSSGVPSSNVSSPADPSASQPSPPAEGANSGLDPGAVAQCEQLNIGAQVSQLIPGVPIGNAVDTTQFSMDDHSWMCQYYTNVDSVTDAGEYVLVEVSQTQRNDLSANRAQLDQQGYIESPMTDPTGIEEFYYTRGQLGGYAFLSTGTVMVHTSSSYNRIISVSYATKDSAVDEGSIESIILSALNAAAQSV